jgi:hypothetical protein
MFGQFDNLFFNQSADFSFHTFIPQKQAQCASVKSGSMSFF